MATKFVSGKIMTGLLAAAISASAMAVSVPASAEPFRQVVRYDDLDLATAKGQKRLESRLRSAVRKMCTIPGQTGSLIVRVNEDCMNTEMAKVEKKAKVAIAEYKAKRALARNDDAIVGN